MEKVTYIIPIHKYDETVEKYLTRALNSLKYLEGSETFKTMFVGPKDICEKCGSLYKTIECPQQLTLLDTTEEDIYKKINFAVTNCVTPYFSILEFDDEYYSYWNLSAQKILEKERYGILLCINELINEKREGVSLLNEIAWDAAFTDELGFINVEELKVFKDFNVTGAYIKTDDFISIGMLKPSMKIATWYEFLLRMCNNEKKVYVLPRVGYIHTILREDSYMIKSSQEITQEEGKWLIDYALEEYTKKEDSNKSFKKE